MGGFHNGAQTVANPPPLAQSVWSVCISVHWCAVDPRLLAMTHRGTRPHSQRVRACRKGRLVLVCDSGAVLLMLHSRELTLHLSRSLTLSPPPSIPLCFAL